MNAKKLRKKKIKYVYQKDNNSLNLIPKNYKKN
jgi:hypothetical protein